MPDYEIWYAQVVTRMGRLVVQAEDQEEAMKVMTDMGGVKALKWCDDATVQSRPEFISCQPVQDNDRDSTQTTQADTRAAGDQAGEG